jgi:hypothetical protein
MVYLVLGNGDICNARCAVINVPISLWCCLSLAASLPHAISLLQLLPISHLRCLSLLAPSANLLITSPSLSPLTGPQCQSLSYTAYHLLAPSANLSPGLAFGSASAWSFTASATAPVVFFTLSSTGACFMALLVSVEPPEANFLAICGDKYHEYNRHDNNN